LHRATCRRFDKIPACDGRKDGQTDGIAIASTALAMRALRCAVKKLISGFAKVVVERCGFHHWIAQMILWGEVVSVFLYLLYFPSYDVINNVIMSDADCTPAVNHVA